MRKVILALILLVVFFGCKKESNNNTNITGITASVKLVKNSYNYFYTPFYPTPYAPYVTHEEKAWVSFADSASLLDAGTVKLGDSVIPKSLYGAYYENKHLNSSATGWSGLLDGNAPWSITGNSSSGLPAFTTPSYSNFPTFLSLYFSQAPIINRTNSFTINWDNSVPADSVSITILSFGTHGTGPITTKSISSGTIAGNINSYTFLPSQLASLDSSWLNPYGGGNITEDEFFINGTISKQVIVSGVTVNMVNYASKRINVVIK